MKRLCEHQCGTLEHILIVRHIQKIYAHLDEGTHRFWICFILKRVKPSAKHSNMACAGNNFFLIFICTSLRSAPQVINQVIQFLLAYLGQMCCVDCFVFFVIAVPPCSNAHEINGIQIMVVQHGLIYITIGGNNRTHQFIAAIMLIR